MPRTAASFTYATRALVLRARPLGEKDRVLTLFSPEKGRFSAVAKGARGPKSRLAALAQPFVVARFMLAKGRSLDIISQAQIENNHAQITGDLMRTAWASFGCELADALPEGLPDEGAWEILSVFLGALAQSQNDAATEAAGVWFEVQWLAHAGYAPIVGNCVRCETKIALPTERVDEARIAFSPALGGTLCDHCARSEAGIDNIGVAALRALHRLERSRRVPDSLALAPFDLDLRAGSELARVVRRSLLAHLGGRLRSMALLEEVRGAARVQAFASAKATDN